MKIKRLMAGLVAGTLTAVAMPLSAMAATTKVVVTPGNLQGWSLNADPTTVTDYEFSTAKKSIGAGSIYVKPIGANAKDKFIAIKTLNADAATINSVSYDYLIAGANRTSADAVQFYMNLYVNQPGSSTFYDCRFDYAPLSGSTTNFTTAAFAKNDTAINVATRSGSPACPTTLAGMPVGSKISIMAISIGDTSTSDIGLAGYLDKVVVASTTDTVTYDFEVSAPVVSKPAFTSPANNAVLTTAEAVKLDWTDATSSIAGPITYQYEAYSSASYTTPIYTQSGITVSELTTPNTPEGTYYLRVRAVDSEGNQGPWSNDASAPFKTTIKNSPSTLAQCSGNGYKAFTNPAFSNSVQCTLYVLQRGGNGIPPQPILQVVANILNTIFLNIRL